jgi:hypothetical protein
MPPGRRRQILPPPSILLRLAEWSPAAAAAAREEDEGGRPGARVAWWWAAMEFLQRAQRELFVNKGETTGGGWFYTRGRGERAPSGGEGPIDPDRCEPCHLTELV